MLLELKFIKNKVLRRFLEHVLYIAVTSLVVPISYFETFVVLPTIMEHWSLALICHLGFTSFLTFNICGNIIYGMFTNTTIKGKTLEGFNKDEWTLCSVCKCLRPPRAWHCDTCEICVLKRDHHCRFIACCVGYFNHRYFMLLTFYVAISMCYIFYINCKYLSLVFTWNTTLVLKLICPFGGLVLDYGSESVFVFFLVLNVLNGIANGFLFIYHFNNLLRGRLVPETRSCSKYFIHDKGWKLNVIEVFGSRWYLTWISPTINSVLPGNGIEWPVDNKYKIC